MKDRDLIDHLRGAEWPSPSPVLRARVVATVVKGRRIPLSDRLWHSRMWRVGMTTVAASLIVVNVWPLKAPARPGPLTPAGSQIELTQLARAAGLPEDAAAGLARRALIGPPRLASASDPWLLLLGDDR